MNMKKYIAFLLVALLCLTSGCSSKELPAVPAETIVSNDPLVGSWHTVGLYYEGDIFTVSQMETMEVLADITIELTANHHFTGVFTAQEREAVDGLWAEEYLDGFDHVYSMSLGAAMILNNRNTDIMYFGFADNNGDLMLILNRDGTNSHQKPVVNGEDVYAMALSIVASSEESENDTPADIVATEPYSPFTNDYGTPTTVCAHKGCSRYIATSGDSNCCIAHSQNCLNCGCYIDEDAMYCMDCLSESMENSKSNSKSDSDKLGGCQFEDLDGSTCGAKCTDYPSLCNYHFELLNAIYENMTD